MTKIIDVELKKYDFENRYKLTVVVDESSPEFTMKQIFKDDDYEIYYGQNGPFVSCYSITRYEHKDITPYVLNDLFEDEQFMFVNIYVNRKHGLNYTLYNCLMTKKGVEELLPKGYYLEKEEGWTCEETGKHIGPSYIIKNRAYL